MRKYFLIATAALMLGACKNDNVLYCFRPLSAVPSSAEVFILDDIHQLPPI